MLKSYCVVALVFCFHQIHGQGLDSPIKSEIEVLHRQKVDTIVEIRYPRSDFDDTLTGIGIVHPMDRRYLIYKINNRVCSKKFEEHCNSDCSDMVVSVSKVYESANDTLFRWLQAYLDTVRHEDLCPYISKQMINGIEVYIPLHIDHVARYHIEFYINNEQFGKLVEPVDLTKASFGQSDNLNYDYNHRTKLSDFFYLLTGYFERIDSKYIF